MCEPSTVGVGHDDNLVVPGLLAVEGGLVLAGADAGADRSDEGADFLVVEDLVELAFSLLISLPRSGRMAW